MQFSDEADRRPHSVKKMPKPFRDFLFTKRFVGLLTKRFVDKTMSNEKIKPTTSELEILNILWSKGPSTVRDVHDVITESKEAGYTTTLKLMQIMHDKKLLKRDETSKSHVYTADVSQEKMQGQMVTGMIENVFNGSASRLIMQALGTHKADAKELSEIRKYLDEIEKAGRKK